MRRSFRVLLVLALFALTAGQLMAQIVTNGDMTDYDRAALRNPPCLTAPLDDTQEAGGLGGTPVGTHANPRGWFDVLGTADYYLQCGNTVPVASDRDLPDAVEPEDGAFIGLWVATGMQVSGRTTSYREYIQNRLDKRLEPGKSYTLSGRVAVRNEDWMVQTQSLYAPRDITFMVTQDDQVMRVNGVIARRTGNDVVVFNPGGPSYVFEVRDEQGHGNWNLMGAERWQDFSTTFTVPDEMTAGAEFLLISPGPNRLLTRNDLVPVNAGNQATENRSYIYVDGLKIEEVPSCNCKDVEFSLTTDYKVSSDEPDSKCCYTLKVRTNRPHCVVKELHIQRIVRSTKRIAGVETVVEEVVRDESPDPRTIHWNDNGFTFRECPIDVGGAHDLIRVSVTLGNGEKCTFEKELICPCNSCDKQPTVLVRKRKWSPGVIAPRPYECCYEVVAVNYSGCPDTKISGTIEINGDLSAMIDEPIGSSPESIEKVLYRFCIRLGEVVNIRVSYQATINGTDVCERRELTERLECNAADDEKSGCCRNAAITVTPYGATDGAVPGCLGGCKPVAIRLEYSNGKPLCDGLIVMYDERGREVKAVNVPLQGAIGSSYVLYTVCPDGNERTFTFMMGRNPMCKYTVTIPACGRDESDPNRPPSLNKQSGGTPHHDHDHGDAGPFTMSVNDLRGVQYGTFTGTDVKALMEQAKESSTMPTGLYVALIRNAAGQLVEWKTFVK